MTIQLFKEGSETPERQYESEHQHECRDVRRRWIKDISKLPHTYYIKIIPEDRIYNLKPFEEIIKRKQREREKYEQFCAKHGIYQERQQLSGDPEKRTDISNTKKRDIPVRKKVKLDYRGFPM